MRKFPPSPNPTGSCLCQSQRSPLRSRLQGFLQRADTLGGLRGVEDQTPQCQQFGFQLLALGYANQEIGAKLFISVRTVDTHRAHIMRKLRLKTRAELVFFALAHGLIGAS